MNFTLVKGHLFQLWFALYLFTTWLESRACWGGTTHIGSSSSFRFLVWWENHYGKTTVKQQKPATTRSKTKDIKTAGNMHAQGLPGEFSSHVPLVMNAPAFMFWSLTRFSSILLESRFGVRAIFLKRDAIRHHQSTAAWREKIKWKSNPPSTLGYFPPWRIVISIARIPKDTADAFQRQGGGKWRHAHMPLPRGTATLGGIRHGQCDGCSSSKESAVGSISGVKSAPFTSFFFGILIMQYRESLFFSGWYPVVRSVAYDSQQRHSYDRL